MELGSDFHSCVYPVADNSAFLKDKILYASGRQALKHLVLTNDWERIWLPSYFCGESFSPIRSLIDICYYSIIPGQRFEDCIPIEQIKQNDALLLVNYFGMYGFKDTTRYNCAVIEDHTHDLIGVWARNSNADWCIASLRKTLPIADGGILWSPKVHPLPQQLSLTPAVANGMALRYCAMEQKHDYLSGEKIDKDLFLKLFRRTEEQFTDYELSDCSAKTHEILAKIDIETWYESKRINYQHLLSKLVFRNSQPLIKDIEGITPFSMVILFDRAEQRENARKYLISRSVYPAILWPGVSGEDPSARDFASRVLSIHCDARYTPTDMSHLASILNPIL